MASVIAAKAKIKQTRALFQPIDNPVADVMLRLVFAHHRGRKMGSGATKR